MRNQGALKKIGSLDVLQPKIVFFFSPIFSYNSKNFADRKLKIGTQNDIRGVNVLSS